MTPSLRSPAGAGARGTTLAPVLLALALLVAALSSCGGGSQVVARVGDRTITVTDFEQFAKQLRTQNPWLPDTARHMLLDDLVRRELLMNEAEQRGMLRDTMLLAVRREAEDDLLQQALSDQIAPRDIPVSDAEIEAYYDWHRTDYHVHAIYAPSHPMILEALKRLRAGEPFEQLAARANAPGGPVPPGGDLGWVPGGGTIEPLDSAIRTAKLGAIVGPLEVGPNNWFLVRVIERRPDAVPPLAGIREQVRQQLNERKHRVVIERFIDDLSERYRVRPEPGGAQELFAIASASGDTSASRHVPEESRVLARYDAPRGEATYTVADALNDLHGNSEAPDYSSVPAIQRWIQARVVRRLVTLEAQSRGLEDDPVVAHDIKDRVESTVLRSIVDVSVTPNLPLTDADLRAEYERRMQGRPAPPYDSLPPQIVEQLRNLTAATVREQRVRTFTDDLRRKYPVTIHEDVLRHIAWPTVTAAPPMTPGRG